MQNWPITFGFVFLQELINIVIKTLGLTEIGAIHTSEKYLHVPYLFKIEKTVLFHHTKSTSLQ